MLTSQTGGSERALLQTGDWLNQVFGLYSGVGASGAGCVGLGVGTCVGVVGAGRLRRSFNRE